MKNYKKEISNLRIENELLIRQLQSLQLELVSRKSLSVDYIPIKETLPYHLGKIMIENSNGILSIFKLFRVLKKTVQEISFDGDYIENIVSIDDLLDSKHLSYRLGLIYLRNNYSFWNRCVRPWLLYAEIKKFRKEKAKVE